MNLTTKEKASYGLGAVGKDMVYMLSSSYILYYYQDILGISAIAMGVIIGLLVACFVFYKKYILTDEKLKEITEELQNS